LQRERLQGGLTIVIRTIYVSAVFVLGMTLFGCLPSPQQSALQRDVDETKNRLSYLERRVTSENLDQAGRNLSSVTQKQADIQADMDNLRVEIQSLKGRLDELNQQGSRQQEELALLRDQLVMKTSNLESKLQQPAGTETATGPAAADSASPAAPAAAAAQPEEVYKQGLDLVREKGDFAGGRQVFQRFLQENPQNPLAPNAMYWIGETYYAEKDYESAIVQFQEVLQKYAQHPKAASALFKQGLCFQAMGDTKSALILFEKVASGFPDAPEADFARKKVAELGKK
jgi:tol-pal system protein YbgF